MKSHFLQNLKHLSPTHHGSSWIGFYTYDVLDWVEKTPPTWNRIQSPNKFQYLKIPKEATRIYKLKKKQTFNQHENNNNKIFV